MAQHLPKPPRRQMPCVACPHLLDIETFHQLTKDGLNPIAHLRQVRWPRGFLMFGRLVRRHQLQIVCLTLFPQCRTPIIPVTQCPPASLCQQVISDLHVRNVTWGKTKIGDHPGPGEDHMPFDAKESLPRDMIVAIGRNLPQSPTAVGTREAADRDGKRVDQRHNESSDLLESVRQLLADPEAGQRIDALIDLWKSRLQSRGVEQKAIAEAQRDIYYRSLWARGILSLVVLVIVGALGWRQTISGEAVVGILAAFAGYLWGEQNSRG